MKNSINVDLSRVKVAGWKPAIKPAVYAVLGGLMLALYMLTWAGVALFILIGFVFFAVESSLIMPAAGARYNGHL